MQNVETQSSMSERPVARVEIDLEDLIPSFLNNRKNDLVELKASVARSDFQNLERIGHILKGVSASYGFDKLGEYGAHLETAARKQNIKDCGEAVGLMDVYMRDVVIVFE